MPVRAEIVARPDASKLAPLDRRFLFPIVSFCSLLRVFMRLNPDRRIVTLGAREFAVFGVPGRSGGAASAWRTAAGTEWHNKLASRATAESKAWKFETPVKLLRIHGRWTVEIEGRIDQWREDKDRILVREVKTVSGEIDAPAEFFRKKYREHFVQLAVYCAALAADPAYAGRRISGEVLYADITSGVTLAVKPDESPDDLLALGLDAVARFAEDRHDARTRLSGLRFRRAHETPRDGWEDARANLDLAAGRAKVTLLEAPTGFGKTALALDFALARLRDGLCDRILYLTGKNSGRIQVFRELERMVSPGAIRALDLRRRDDHELSSVSDDPGVWREKWIQSGFSPRTVFDSGHASLERVRVAGEAAGVPPWEITRALLPVAELIVADYNHIFSPDHAGLLAEADGFDLGRTLLVVDEAHNLPDRAAAARSLATDAATAERLLTAFEAAKVVRDARGALLEWFRLLEDLPECDRLDGVSENALHDIAPHLRDTLRAAKLPWGELSDENADALSDTLRWADRLSGHGEDNILLHSPGRGALRLDFIDASGEIGGTLRATGGALLMSATISPTDEFAESCGLAAKDFSYVRAEAPWRDGAYRVIVDTRVDTRYRTRDKHFATTAQAVLTLGEAASPVAAFFPSYRYAETIATYVEALDPGFRVAVQKPGGTPEDHAAFLEENLIGAHAIFLVLGGGMAEGVDLLGGRVTHSLVVGPAIPDTTSPVNRARHARARRESDEASAFRRTGLVPGMRKVNQALGRLVRAPGQTATVVLHCKRFADRDHAALLASEYTGGVIVRNDAELAEALKKTRDAPPFFHP